MTRFREAGLTGRAPRQVAPPLDRLWVPRASAVLPETVVTPPIPWTPLGNDRVGDCVEAATAHAIQAAEWTLSSTYVPFLTSQVVDTYNLYRREYDQGKDLGTLPEVFETWVEKGLWGWKGDYATVTTDEPTLKAAINEFGNVLLEVVLHDCDATAYEYGRPWTVERSPGNIYGLHEIALVGYNRSWFEAVTWGTVIKVSPRWVADYTSLATSLKDLVRIS